MQALSRHGLRTAVTLLPLIFAVLHAVGALPMGVLHRLDDIIYDARLRMTMPGTLDERVVIVDIDEKSLEELGHWPWPRDRLAGLVDTLFDRHGIAMLGFDTVFAEPDGSSGLSQLERLGQGELSDQPGFAEQLARLRPQLDHDNRFAQALRGRPVVLGYYFTSGPGGRTIGQLPAPVVRQEALAGRAIRSTSWSGHGANIGHLCRPRLPPASSIPCRVAMVWCAPCPCWPSFRATTTSRWPWPCSGNGRASPVWSPGFRPTGGGPDNTRRWTAWCWARCGTLKSRSTMAWRRWCRSGDRVVRRADRSATCRRPMCSRTGWNPGF